MAELILRTVVIRFDGRVVEVFGNHSNEVMRAHLALMKEPQAAVGPNRKGRRLVWLGATSIGVDEDEWERLAPLLERIREAVREAGALPYFRELNGPAGPVVEVEGAERIMLGSNN